MRTPCPTPILAALCFLAVAGFAETATAQVLVEVRTVTQLDATAGLLQQSIPHNTLLSSPQGVQVGQTTGPSCSTLGSANVTFAGGASTARTTFVNTATCHNGPSCIIGNESSAGPHSVRVSLSSPVPVTGHVLVSMSGSTGIGYMSNAVASWRIDVGDDRSVESSGGISGNGSASGFVERPLVLGPVPSNILLEAHVRARAYPFLGSASANMTLTVDFRAGPGRLSTIGAPCGPQLVGTLRRNGTASDLRLDASSTVRAPNAFLLVGTQALSLALPPTGCVLRTDPILAAPVTMTNGTWSFGLPLPEPFPALDLRMQFVEGQVVNGVPHWHLSESIRMVLP